MEAVQWKQEVGTVDVRVALPKGTKKKNVTVYLDERVLKIWLKGNKKPLLEGVFHHAVATAEYFYDEEDEEVQVSLTRTAADKGVEWPALFDVAASIKAGAFVKVTQDYLSQSADELDLKVGMVLEVLCDVTDGQAKAQVHGTSIKPGIFYAQYVVDIPAAAVEAEKANAAKQIDALKQGKICKHGMMAKKGTSGLRSWDERFVVLEQGKLAFFKKGVKDARGIVKTDDIVRVQRNTTKSAKRPNCLEVITKAKAFYFACASAQELDEWVTAIESWLPEVNQIRESMVQKGFDASGGGGGGGGAKSRRRGTGGAAADDDFAGFGFNMDDLAAELDLTFDEDETLDPLSVITELETPALQLSDPSQAPDLSVAPPPPDDGDGAGDGTVDQYQTVPLLEDQKQAPLNPTSVSPGAVGAAGLPAGKGGAAGKKKKVVKKRAGTAMPGADNSSGSASPSPGGGKYRKNRVATTPEAVKGGGGGKVKWKMVKMNDGRAYYYNTQTMETTWTRPADF